MNRNIVNFLIGFILESDAIENIKDDPSLLKLQIQERRKNGHVGAMLLLESLARSGKQFISKKLVCRIQNLITSEQHLKGALKLDQEFIGKYRTVPVRVGTKIFPPQRLVPPLMKSMLDKIKIWQKNCLRLPTNERMSKIADFHFDFERIHPFVDGNGRTGRALVYYLVRYADMEPFIFTNADKYSTYYLCFENKEDMRRYFFKQANFSLTKSE